MRRDTPPNDGSAAHQTADDALQAGNRDPLVIDELVAEIPIASRELDVIEIYLGHLLDLALPGTGEAKQA